MTTKETLKKWFRTGEKPTQAQFWAWLESYHHKEETIPAKSVEGLPQLMERSLVQNQFENHQTDPLAHAELFENKVDKEQGKGLSANDFTNEYKQQLDELAQREKTEIDTENFFLKDEKITLIQGTNTEAPLNFQQGNLTYSPRNGQVEYSENGLFFTHDNQRRQVVFIDDTGLTTQQIAQKLKRIINGEQFTIKYTDGTMTSAKYDELLNAVRDKQVEEIQVDTAGLEEFRFVFVEKYISMSNNYRFKDVVDETKLQEFNSSGFYLDFFEKETNKFLKRNVFELPNFYSGPSKMAIVPNDFRNAYIRISKYGDYRNYAVHFVYGFNGSGGVREADVKMTEEDNEILLVNEYTYKDWQGEFVTEYHSPNFNGSYGRMLNIFIGGKIETTITNFFVNDNPYSVVENFSINSVNHSNRVGTKFSLNDIRYSYEDVNTYIEINTRNRTTGYYKIQLINTENQEVVFEKDNREDNTDTITLNNVQLPKMLTIKLWTNDSLND